MNTNSKYWLPDNFSFDKYNPFHLYYIKKNINNFINILTDKKMKVEYLTYPTIIDKNDNDTLYLTNDIPDIDRQVGMMLLESSRYINDESTNLDLNNEQINFFYHLFCKLNAINYIKLNAKGYLNYIISFDNMTITRKFVDLKNKCIDVFKNKNWNTFYFYLMFIELIPKSKIKSLKDFYKEYNSITNILTSNEIEILVLKWHNILESENKDIENDYGIFEEKELNKLENIFETQKNIIINNVKKIGISTKLKTTIRSLSNDKINIKSIKYNLNIINVLNIKLSKNVIDNNIFELFEHKFYILKHNNDIINKGIKLGNRLLHQLQYRDSVNIRKITHLKQGKIDNRLLYKAGLNNNKIFSNIEINKPEKKNIIISIDASHSVINKWEQIQIFVTSLVYAIYNIESLDVQVFYRMTYINKNKKFKNENKDVKPVIIKAFDNESTLQTIKKLFKYIKPQGGSPEGILHQHILNNITTNNNIFINISDGLPEYFNHNINYVGDEAIEHTKKRIDNMIRNNYKILSYFIGNIKNYNNFEKMYGKKNSYFVDDINKIDKIAYQLNEMFFK